MQEDFIETSQNFQGQSSFNSVPSEKGQSSSDTVVLDYPLSPDMKEKLSIMISGITQKIDKPEAYKPFLRED